MIGIGACAVSAFAYEASASSGRADRNGPEAGSGRSRYHHGNWFELKTTGDGLLAAFDSAQARGRNVLVSAHELTGEAGGEPIS